MTKVYSIGTRRIDLIKKKDGKWKEKKRDKLAKNHQIIVSYDADRMSEVCKDPYGLCRK